MADASGAGAAGGASGEACEDMFFEDFCRKDNVLFEDMSEKDILSLSLSLSLLRLVFTDTREQRLQVPCELKNVFLLNDNVLFQDVSEKNGF